MTRESGDRIAMTDEQLMKRALELAKKGIGYVSPNPLVGAVIVKDGKIIGEGYHECYGQAHAEVNAVRNATEDVEGSTIYVTLEPCAHYGKTPPCAELLLKSKFQRVVIGCLDPNEQVSGRGVKTLRDAGITVDIGILEQECLAINEVFFHYITTKRPFVVMKTAMTLDGKIATVTGASKWITDVIARERVHHLRNRLTGIMVGVDTVIADDPELSCRIENGRNPVRLIVDSRLRIPIEAQVLGNQNLQRTIIGTTEMYDKEKYSVLGNMGIEVIVLPTKDDRVDLQAWMKVLGEKNIDSILLEGGATLNFSMLKEGLVHQVQSYIAPKIFGGATAPTPVGGNGFEKIADAIQLEQLKVEQVGEDIWVCGNIQSS